MGQYRQWLHYRQVDQQLHALKNHLTAEIQRIHEENAVDMPPLATDNRIIQALLLYTKQSSSPTTNAGATHSDTTAEQRLETISPLFERSRLPNFELLFEYNAQQSQPVILPTNVFAPLPPLPHPPQEPRPNDEISMLDNQQQTEPQTVLPWWLRQAALSAPGNGLDQQSIRTNRLVQRWLERWGRQENAGTQHASNDNGHQLDAPEEGTKQ